MLLLFKNTSAITILGGKKFFFVCGRLNEISGRLKSFDLFRLCLGCKATAPLSADHFLQKLKSVWSPRLSPDRLICPLRRSIRIKQFSVSSLCGAGSRLDEQICFIFCSCFTPHIKCKENGRLLDVSQFYFSEIIQSASPRTFTHCYISSVGLRPVWTS